VLLRHTLELGWTSVELRACLLDVLDSGCVYRASVIGATVGWGGVADEHARNFTRHRGGIVRRRR
jgi:hypothetical protein